MCIYIYICIHTYNVSVCKTSATCTGKEMQQLNL